MDWLYRYHPGVAPTAPNAITQEEIDAIRDLFLSAELSHVSTRRVTKAGHRGSASQIVPVHYLDHRIGHAVTMIQGRLPERKDKAGNTKILCHNTIHHCEVHAC